MMNDQLDTTTPEADDVAAATPAAEYYEPRFPLARLRESPTNPRRHFGDLGELAGSIAAKGILVPLRARPLAEPETVEVDGELVTITHELVYGHRRYRAAKLAGRTDVPVTLCMMNDEEAAEAQIIENGQRLDVHPLEEGDGYKFLHERHRMPVARIAAKVGKSESYVYARLRLAELGPEARELFLAEKFGIEVALTLASVSNPEHQAKAAAEVARPQWEGGPPRTTADARRLIVQNYMLRLADVPWSLDDATLVPTAGACTTCPRNTATQRSLFGDDPKAALCTDRACYQSKEDAAWVRKKVEAAAKGWRVIEGDEAKQLAPNGYLSLYNSPFTELHNTCEDDPKGRTYAKLLEGRDFPRVLLRTSDGDVHELVEKKTVLKAAGVDLAQVRKEAREELETKAAKGDKKAEAKLKNDDWKRERDLDETIDRAKLSAIAMAALNRPFNLDDRAYWQWLAGCLTRALSYDGADLVVERRNLKTKGRPEAALIEEVGCLAGGGCRGVIAELLFARTLSNTEDDDAEEIARFYKVDLKAIEAQARAEASQPKKPAPAKASAKPSAKPAAKKPAAKAKAKPAKAPAKSSSKKPAAKKAAKGKGR